MIEDLIKEIEENITRDTFNSNRNVVRGLSDCYKYILTKFSTHYPSLIILENLQIDKRIALLCKFDTEINQFAEDIERIYQFRNKVDHGDKIHPKKEKLIMLVERLKSFYSFYQNYQKGISLRNLDFKSRYTEELTNLINSTKDLKIEDLEQKISNFQSYLANFDSLPCEEKLSKFLEVREYQGITLQILINNLMKEQSLELENYMLNYDEMDDNYYEIKGELDKILGNSEK